GAVGNRDEGPRRRLAKRRGIAGGPVGIAHAGQAHVDDLTGPLAPCDVGADLMPDPVAEGGDVFDARPRTGGGIPAEAVPGTFELVVARIAVGPGVEAVAVFALVPRDHGHGVDDGLAVDVVAAPLDALYGPAQQRPHP